MRWWPVVLARTYCADDDAEPNLLGRLPLAKCVSSCPDVETRKGSCDGAQANQCVADNRGAVTIILIGGIVAAAVVIVAALLI